MNRVEFMRLWDAYSGLLTPTQQEITNLYFNLDLTVSEIAAEKGISRQAVSDCMNACKKQLKDYENKLHFVKLNIQYSLEVSFMMTDAGRWAEKFLASHPEFKAEIGELRDIIGRDYSNEAQRELENPQTGALLKKSYYKESDAD